MEQPLNVLSSSLNSSVFLVTFDTSYQSFIRSRHSNLNSSNSSSIQNFKERSYLTIISEWIYCCDLLFQNSNFFFIWESFTLNLLCIDKDNLQIKCFSILWDTQIPTHLTCAWFAVIAVISCRTSTCIIYLSSRVYWYFHRP